MMSMVGAAVAPNTAPASVLGGTWAPTDAGGYRSSLRRRHPPTDNRHVSTGKWHSLTVRGVAQVRQLSDVDLSMDQTQLRPSGK